MGGLQKNKNRGFTIIEVMIVLAVTGALLAAAIILIGGKQNEAAFQQAVNDAVTAIQQTIGDVENGFYPNQNGGNFNCTFVSSTLPPSINSGSTGQGTNQPCIFLGKLLAFNPHATTYNIYTIAALRQPVSQETTGLANSYPVIIYKSAEELNAPTNDVTAYNLESGLNVEAVNGSSSGGSVAFIPQSLGTYSGSVLSSGSQQVGLYTMNTADSNGTSVDNLNSDLATLATSGSSVSSATICLASGTTNQSGLVTLNYGSGQLQATVSIKNGTAC